MDPDSLQLGTEHLWNWLVRLLSKDSEWLNAKVKFFLPKMDLCSGDKAQDATQGVILQLRRLHAQGRATWQAFIHCVCMELDVPLDLEVPLLSTWGHGVGKGRREGRRAAGWPLSQGAWEAREGQDLPESHGGDVVKTGAKFCVSEHFSSKLPSFTKSAGDPEGPFFHLASS